MRIYAIQVTEGGIPHEPPRVHSTRRAANRAWRLAWKEFVRIEGCLPVDRDGEPVEAGEVTKLDYFSDEEGKVEWRFWSALVTP